MKDSFLLKKYKVFISFCDQIWHYVTTFTYMKYSRLNEVFICCWFQMKSTLIYKIWKLNAIQWIQDTFICINVKLLQHTSISWAHNVFQGVVLET